MSDSFTETTSKSLFTRIKNALSGIVTGFLLVIAALVLLFWNEGRAVKTATALAEGSGIVISVDPLNVTSNVTDKLVHFSGELAPSGRLEDALFAGVTAPDGTLRLVRKVEMYQWKESKSSKTRKKIGGGEETVTTYNYDKTWSKRAIDSSRFRQSSGHRNPPMNLESQTFSVETGRVGQIKLRGDDFSHLGEETLVAPDETLRNIVQNHFLDGREAVVSGNSIVVRTNPNFTTIGDLRISFFTGDANTISVIGKYKDSSITPFTTSNGRKLSMFREGIADAKTMFDDAISNNTMWTWILRFGGFFAMLIGFKMIFSVVGVLGDIIPLVGDVFRFATGLAAFALAAVLSTLIIGFAWIYYRPIIGISIIVIGLVLAGAALILGKFRARQKAGSIDELPAT